MFFGITMPMVALRRPSAQGPLVGSLCTLTPGGPGPIIARKAAFASDYVVAHTAQRA